MYRIYINNRFIEDTYNLKSAMKKVLVLVKLEIGIDKDTNIIVKWIEEEFDEYYQWELILDEKYDLKNSYFITTIKF